MRIAPFAVALALAAPLASPPIAAQEKHGAGAAAAEGGKDWKDHKGDIPFLVGREAGMKEVEFTGKPILFFYTATW